MDFYSYQRPLGPIADDASSRNAFITIFDQASKQDMVRFCLQLGHHLIEKTQIQPYPQVFEGFDAMSAWLNGDANYHPARNLSFEVSRLLKSEQDMINIRFYRTMAQLLASPHVKFHGLWATDFAIPLINQLYPNDLQAVIEERRWHIDTLLAIKNN